MDGDDLLTPHQVADRMDLDHKEVIRRLRRGDIDGFKKGWIWLITESSYQKAVESDWYKRRLKRLEQNQSPTTS